MDRAKEYAFLAYLIDAEVVNYDDCESTNIKLYCMLREDGYVDENDEWVFDD